MKSFKVKLFVCLLFCFSISVKSQNLETIKVYHDYSKTKLSEIYTVLKNTATKQGSYKSFDEDGGLLYEMNFKNNLAHGLNKIYHASLSASFTKNPTSAYGKIWKTFNYSNGVLHGSNKVYTYNSGKQALQMENIYKNGEVIKEIIYYENGKIKSILQTDGLCTTYFENGNKNIEYTNINKAKVGLYTDWFVNGKISLIGYYNEQGLEHGIWKEWDENGILTETLYENGIDIEKEKIKIVAQKKLDEERNDKLRKELEAKLQKEAKEIAEQKIKEERQQKNNLFNSKIKITNEKSQQVEKMYVVIDKFQTSLLEKDVYKIRKKNIYNAFEILRNDLSEKINNSKNIDEKITFTENLENLLNMVFELSEKNTKDLEKDLKNITNPDKIKEIFNL